MEPDRFPEGDRRWVDLVGAFNFRDLGGYRSTTGGVVRWRSLYRSDALNHLSFADVEAVEDLGVEMVIDLRSPDEIAQIGRGLLADASVEYLTAPVIPSATGEARGAPPGDDMAERYLWYLDVGRQAFIDVFSVLTTKDPGAVVFHCAAGKDRTGVLAAMILSVLGVAEADIASDYELTGRALPLILDRLSHDPIHGEAVSRMPPERRVVDGKVMQRFLRRLEETHGGAESWLVAAGITTTSLDDMRLRLLTSS